jgi:hypothetical protein
MRVNVSSVYEEQMTKAMAAQTLATKFKEAFQGADTCVVEIRTPAKNAAGQRLHKTLALAGIDAQLIDVAASPQSGILIEASQQCAKVALSIQTAFGMVGLEAHLLVQNVRRPELVVIHLNSEPGPRKALRK